ncbi:MAG TPA: alpha/beta fold hydrolase [Anaerolineales bacterium]|nr:alpha/beta fold hydrolase [Anaerolineales bacterium]
MRVVTIGDQSETIIQTPIGTTTPDAANGSPTPQLQIIGDFAVAPIIINTLPASASPKETPVLPTNTPIDGEELLADLSIEALASRAYGQDAGTLTIESVLESPGGFVRALISYPSDGLNIFGFMNIPAGEGPFPVVIFVHGWVASYKYETLDYSVRYADDLTRRGFIVIHPNLRGYPPSDNGPDYFGTGEAIDILNLVAIVQRDAGKTGLLLQADSNAIAIWGHSTGGGIAIRVVTVNLPSATGPGPAVKAAILYAPMSGDDSKNAYHTFYTFSGQTRWSYEITVPPEDLIPISPMYYYDRIEAAVQIHHGELDSLIPVDWSRETCDQMKEAGVTVECYDYRTQTHNFCCDSYKWMLDRLVAFMDIYLP